jgi:hypothetical protein
VSTPHPPARSGFHQRILRSVSFSGSASSSDPHSDARRLQPGTWDEKQQRSDPELAMLNIRKEASGERDIGALQRSLVFGPDEFSGTDRLSPTDTTSPAICRWL